MKRYIVLVELDSVSKTNLVSSVISGMSKDFIQIQHNLWIMLSEKNVLQITESIFQVIITCDSFFVGELNASYDSLFYDF